MTLKRSSGRSCPGAPATISAISRSLMISRSTTSLLSELSSWEIDLSRVESV